MIASEEGRGVIFIELPILFGQLNFIYHEDTNRRFQLTRKDPTTNMNGRKKKRPAAFSTNIPKCPRNLLHSIEYFLFLEGRKNSILHGSSVEQ